MKRTRSFSNFVVAQRWLLLAAAICLFVFAESSREAPTLNSHRLDVLAHIIAHYLLFASIAFCLARHWGHYGWRTSVLIVGATLLYGVSDELHQSFVPARRASFGDLVVDALGAASGVTIDALLRLLRPSSSSEVSSEP